MARVEGERVNLREVREEDNALLRRWRGDPEILRWLFSDLAPAEDEQRRWFESLASDETRLAFTIETAAGRPIGQAGFKNIDRESRRAELGILIGERAEWGRGLGAEACGLLVRHGFEELGLRRIDCLVLADNARALKLYRKLGFHRDEDVRCEPVRKGGRLREVVCLSLLDSDARAGA